MLSVNLSVNDLASPDEAVKGIKEAAVKGCGMTGRMIPNPAGSTGPTSVRTSEAAKSG